MAQSTITITASISNPSAYDKEAMNRRIAEYNAQKAATTSGFTPLLFDTNTNRNNSFQTVIAAKAAADHAVMLQIVADEANGKEKVQQIKILARSASDALLDQAITLLGGTP